ncbi:MAG TPA: glycosyltransferase [Spirochaetia bacterium]|nr:glycosyltransferase [Spirochaetia bacterium]
MPKAKKPVYSVIIPVYNEQEVVAAAHRELSAVMKSLHAPYELIFVNDGSRDKTYPALYRIAEKDPAVKIVNFSRNFGHQVAISAGMDFAAGDAIVVIDADLQDPPRVIKEMAKKWKQGFEVVYGQRTKRKGESIFKRATASLFYRLIRRLSGVDIPVDTGDFRLIDRKVCDALKAMPERHRFMRGMAAWVGFKQCAVPYERQKRYAGKTKYPLLKMLKFATDAITSFSFKPLRIATVLGFFTSFAGFAYLLYAVIRYFLGAVQEGWTTIIALLIIFNGILFIILGIMGEYLGRVYEEVKTRPLYLVRDTIGFDNDAKKPRGKRS